MVISSTEAPTKKEFFMNMLSLIFPLKAVCQAHDVVLFNFLHFFCKKGGEPQGGDLVVGWNEYQMI